MNGMATQLNLHGRSRQAIFHGLLKSHYSGDGFSDMHFDSPRRPAG